MGAFLGFVALQVRAPGDLAPRPASGGWYLSGLARLGLGPTRKSTFPIRAPQSGPCPRSRSGYLATASADKAVLSREGLLALEHSLRGQRLPCRIHPHLAGGNRSALVPSGSPAQPFPARICQRAERGSQGVVISSKAVYTGQQVTPVGSVGPGDWRASLFPSLRKASPPACLPVRRLILYPRTLPSRPFVAAGGERGCPG